jgi:hypothetical protein
LNDSGDYSCQNKEISVKLCKNQLCSNEVWEKINRDGTLHVDIKRIISFVNCIEVAPWSECTVFTH